MNKKMVVLAGNPNVGKSTVFNALTGMRQHTGNWTGKTVETAKGEFLLKGQRFEVVDLPGTYSLSALSGDERVAGDFIKEGRYDLAVVVCDATCLERNLYLVIQIMEISSNVILCLNLMDEAKRKQIEIDVPLLEERLGIPVIEVTARKKKTLEPLREVIHREAMGKKGEIRIAESVTPEDRIQYAQTICGDVVTYRKEEYNQVDRGIDKYLTNKMTGIPIMLLMLSVVFFITWKGANVPSDLLFRFLSWLGEGIQNGLYQASLPEWLISAVMDGVYRVLSWVISVMLPPMAIFFPLFTLLEDFGYLPRVAFNLDRCFYKAHACGKQALTMCMGFGCNAVGVTGCRIIDSPREKLIAIMTNNFVPCNGRFPTLIALITIFFAGTFSSGQGVVAALLLTVTIMFGVMMTFVVSRVLSGTILKGIPSNFILELPPYRKPQVGKVIIRSILDRTLFILGRAVLVAAPAGLVIWCMANVNVSGSSILLHCSDFLDPFAKLMGLDGVILLAFLLGFPANEIVIPIIIMAYLNQGSIMELNGIMELRDLLLVNGWTLQTAICMMLFTMMHWPCSTTCLTIRKETGSLKWTALSMLLPTAVGILLCVMVTGITKHFLW